MYGDELSYPLDLARFATEPFSPLGGALARKCAPTVSWARAPSAFHACRAPADAELGEEGKGDALAQHAFGFAGDFL